MDSGQRTRLLDPGLFLLFGTTGDLAAKKLFPALYTLYRDGALPERFVVLGIGRRPWDDGHYRSQVRIAVESGYGDGVSIPEDFLMRFRYHRMDMRDECAYEGLRETAQRLEQENNLPPNRLLFLATAPDLFPLIAQQLEWTRPKDGGFRRLLVEKPFGQDLESARAFNERLRAHFDEEEIYRIDHYLGKEMLQNILVLRFANRLFEPVWRAEHVDHIQISVREAEGVKQRGGYYDHSGALRDMVQSHVLQLLALLAMEPPECLDATCIREEKIRVLRSLCPFRSGQEEPDVILGQYGPAEGRRAYREEDGIQQESETETFAALKLVVNNDRWRGVPFYIRTGKALGRSEASIAIVFKAPSGAYGYPGRNADVLILEVQPREGVRLHFNIKQPGTLSDITRVDMEFCQTCRFPGQSPDAYVRLIRDAWAGDMSLFTGWDEIEAAWRLIDSIRSLNKQVDIYPAGQSGPDSADRLLERDGRVWIDPTSPLPDSLNGAPGDPGNGCALSSEAPQRP